MENRLARRGPAAALAVLAAFALPSLGSAQEDAPPVELPPALRGPESIEEAVLLASDGQPAVAGRVPAGTPEAAAELWAAVVDSLSIEGATSTAAPSAFELSFEVRARQESGTNEFLARFAYLDVGPGLVRGVILDDAGRERSTQMRGLSGTGSGRAQYWFRKLRGEGATDGWIELVGRDFADSRDEIDDWAAIAFDVARLTRPNSLRILELSMRRLRTSDEVPAPGLLAFEGDPGVQLPDVDVTGVRKGRAQSLHTFCAGLRWLELDTPDFRDFRSGAAGSSLAKGVPDVFRLVFGVDPSSGRPSVVLVSPGTRGPIQAPGSVLIQCTDWFLYPEDGAPDEQSWLPGRFFAYETEVVPGSASPTLRFADVPSADLYLVDGTLAAALEPKDFRPE